MSISPVSSHGSRGADLVALFDTHTGYHNQREANANVAGASPPVPVANAAPLSAALAHPTRRPSFLAGSKPARGRNARGGESNRHLMRGDRGDEAELPTWQRMEPGERSGGAIPGNNHLEVPVQAESVHGRRIGPQHDGQVGKSLLQQGGVSQLSSAVGMLARKATLERARCMASLTRLLASSPLLMAT